MTARSQATFRPPYVSGVSSSANGSGSSCTGASSGRYRRPVDRHRRDEQLVTAPAVQHPGQRPDLPRQVGVDVHGRVPLAVAQRREVGVAVTVAEHMGGPGKQAGASAATVIQGDVVPGVNGGLGDVPADERGAAHDQDPHAAILSGRGPARYWLARAASWAVVVAAFKKVRPTVVATRYWLARAASWAVMVAAFEKVRPTSVTCFQRSMLSLSITKTDRRRPAPPRLMPYRLDTASPTSASSGKPRSYLRANPSWLSTSCGLMPHTVAPRPVKPSRPAV